MKFFVCIALIAAVASYVAAGPAGVGISSSGGASASAGANQEAESEAQQGAQPSSALDLTRLRKSAYGGGSSGGGYGGSSAGGYGGSSGGGGGYGGSSIPAPPCPKNYLFSCQPNLSPVACSAPAQSYGSAGAYSAPVPTYIAPLPRNLGVGVGVPQPIGYSNQYYQY